MAGRDLIWQAFGLVAVLVAASAGCSSSTSEEETYTADDLANPSTPLEEAHALVRYDGPPTGPADFPEQMLLDFRDCVLASRPGEELLFATSPEQGTDPALDQVLTEQLFAQSDCAFEHGLDAYASIWVPPAQSEMEGMLQRWLAAVDVCFGEAGFDEVPTIAGPPGGLDEPDFEGVIAQDPSLEEPLRACMHREGEEFPGDDTPLG